MTRSGSPSPPPEMHGTLPSQDLARSMPRPASDRFRLPAYPGALGPLLAAETAAATGRLAPEREVMVQAIWFDAGCDTPGRLLLVVHHLVIDGVSWRILISDLQDAWQAVSAGRGAPRLLPVGTSLRHWADHLSTDAARADRVAELPLWRSMLAGPDPLLGTRALNPACDVADTAGHLTFALPVDVTAPLLYRLPALFHGGVNDVLLTAFALAVVEWRHFHAWGGDTSVLIDLEGHGREGGDLDLSRTVGWFTSLFPVRLDPVLPLQKVFAAGKGVNFGKCQIMVSASGSFAISMRKARQCCVARPARRSLSIILAASLPRMGRGCRHRRPTSSAAAVTAPWL